MVILIEGGGMRSVVFTRNKISLQASAVNFVIPGCSEITKAM